MPGERFSPQGMNNCRDSEVRITGEKAMGAPRGDAGSLCIPRGDARSVRLEVPSATIFLLIVDRRVTAIGSVPRNHTYGRPVRLPAPPRTRGAAAATAARPAIHLLREPDSRPGRPGRTV